jgi:hypothetical protein
MPFQSWDPIVEAVFFGCAFLLPLVAVLWVWYDSSGRIDSGRWFWRLFLSALVLFTTPAVALGAAHLDHSMDDVMGVFGWTAIACGCVAILGVLAYAIWGRSPMEEYQGEAKSDRAAGSASPAQTVPPVRSVKAVQTVLPTALATPPAAPAIPTAPRPAPAPARAPAPTGPNLLIKAGADRGRQFPIGHKTTIGRATGCDITLNDNRVSAQHGQVERQGGSFVYLDLKSTNGSFLVVEGREERLLAGQVLVDGDEIRLGGTVLKFVRTPDGGKR